MQFQLFDKGKISMKVRRESMIMNTINPKVELICLSYKLKNEIKDLFIEEVLVKIILVNSLY